MRSFASYLSSHLGIPERSGDHLGSSACLQRRPKVLFIRRENYMAHPRQKRAIEKRLDNEDSIAKSLAQLEDDVIFTSSGREIRPDYVDGQFSQLRLREQVALAQQACVIVGVHGAGLSHVIFAQPGSHLIEIAVPGYKRPHFAAFATWAGLQYRALDFRSRAPPAELVVNAVQSALASF